VTVRQVMIAAGFIQQRTCELWRHGPSRTQNIAAAALKNGTSANGGFAGPAFASPGTFLATHQLRCRPGRRHSGFAGPVPSYVPRGYRIHRARASATARNATANKKREYVGRTGDEGAARPGSIGVQAELSASLGRENRRKPIIVRARRGRYSYSRPFHHLRSKRRPRLPREAAGGLKSM
jgi:hypothetical protein